MIALRGRAGRDDSAGGRGIRGIPAILPILAMLAMLGAAPVGAQGGTEIYVLEVAGDGGSVGISGAPLRVTERAGYDNQPSFTADGGAILYTAIVDGQADTYRFDLGTGETTRVTTTAESEYSPTPVPGRDRFSVVRVEADSTQRLWSFAMDGTDPRLVLADVAPVGYHAWVTDDRLALFVLGDPPTLQIAETRTGTARVAAEGIGRSIQAVPGREAATFTRPVGGEWSIRAVSLGTGESLMVAPLPGPDGYHVWTPTGALLTAFETTLFAWDAPAQRWIEIADVAEWGLGTVTRLAISPDGSRLAIVVDEPAG